MTGIKQPETISETDLDDVQGGNTITVQICHQVVGGNPADGTKNSIGKTLQGPTTTQLHGADKQRD